MKTRFCCALLFSTLLFGCSESDTVVTEPPVANAADEAAPPEVSVGVTFFDSEELRDGAGPVDEDVDKTFQSTASGLKYRVLRKGDGPKPTADQSVTVHYRGWLDDGNEFDSSYSRGQSISFPLGGVIKGWTEGMQLVGKGGMIELLIPSDLGYGPQGMAGAIPPNATLHFVVELLEIQ